MNFHNKVVIVTGSSSGIGAATVKLFAKASADVTIVGRKERKLAAVAEACEQYGRKPLVINADVSKDEDAKGIVEKTIEHFGKLDVLVNNAGASVPSGIQDANLLDAYDKVMATNIRAVVHITSIAVPYLMKTKGTIVNVSSILAQTPIAGYLPYTTSKAALDHFTRCVALELAEYGIRVNSVNPGPVLTDIILNMGFNESIRQMSLDGVKKNIPLKKVSEAEEIAELIAFLASDKARSITGVSYVIDQGTALVGGQSLSVGF